MAIAQRITALPVLSTVAAEDVLAIVDDPAGGAATKKIAVSDLQSDLNKNIKTTAAETAAGVTPTDLNFKPLDVKRYGMDPSATGAVNQVALQNACDSVPASGGTVFIDEPGTYNLDVITNPYISGHKTCLDIKVDGTHLRIGPGVILRLANGQQTDAGGPVDIIVWRTRNDILLNGGGRITGNTAGQTGWTSGYLQVVNGVIVYDTTPTAQVGNNIRVENLQLDDHFSNPVNIGNGGTFNRVRLKHLKGFACGEGFQVIGADDVQIIDCLYHDIANVSAGDGIEVSSCTNFLIDGCEVHSNGEGAAFDLFGSKYGILSNFKIDGWSSAVSAGTTAGSVTADQILVTDGVIRNCTDPQLLQFADGKMVYQNIRAYDCFGTLFQMPDDAGALPPVELYNVLGDSCGPALITGSRKVIWHGGGNINSDSDGLSVSQNSSGETRNLDFSDLDFSGAASNDLLFNAAGLGPQLMVGRFINVLIGAVTELVSTSQDDFTGLNMEVLPNNQASDVGSPFNTPHLKTLVRNANTIATINQPSKDQIVVIEATGAFQVTDKSQGGGVDFNLAGSANFAMTADDRLTLKWNDTAWFELGRSVN